MKSTAIFRPLKPILLTILFSLPFGANANPTITEALDSLIWIVSDDYFKQQGKQIPQTYESWDQFSAFLSGYYSRANHELRKATQGLHNSESLYQDDSTCTFLTTQVNNHVTFKYDEDRVTEYITRICKEISPAPEQNPSSEPPNITDDKVKIASLLAVIGEYETKLKEALDQRSGVGPYWILICGLLILLGISVWFQQRLRTSFRIQREAYSRNQQLAPPSNVPSSREILSDKTKQIPISIMESTSGSSERQLVNTNWLLVMASVIGKAHLAQNPQIPCQDAHGHKHLGSGWGIAVVCDGAGSASHSQDGAKFVVSKALQYFQEIVERSHWVQKETLPSQSIWQELSYKAFKMIRHDLQIYAKQNGRRLRDLSCTTIVAIHSPLGMLCTHIGDGRAAFRDQKGIWTPMLKPHKGTEANQTIFITSDSWLKGELSVSGVKVPEATVFLQSPTSFALMSDGCESHAFETGFFDEKLKLYVELNRPFTGFFEPVLKILLRKRQEGQSGSEISAYWHQFISSGTKRLAAEPDDKTLIIGLLT